MTRPCLARRDETLGMTDEHRDDAVLGDDLHGWRCTRAIGAHATRLVGAYRNRPSKLAELMPLSRPRQLRVPIPHRYAQSLHPI